MQTEALCSTYSLGYKPDPAAYFAEIRKAPGAVLLDSAYPQSDKGRFDILSAWPVDTISIRQGEDGSCFDQRMRAALALLGKADLPKGCTSPFAGGLIGFMSYDFGRHLERLPAIAKEDLPIPPAHFGLYNWALVSDHHLATTELVFHPSLGEAERWRLIDLFTTDNSAELGQFQMTSTMQSDISSSEYREAFDRIQHLITAGDCYQVNLTQRFSGGFTGDTWSAYCALRRACPTPFSAFMELDEGFYLLSLSPERFMRVTGRQVETRPIKGTRPRGSDPNQDQIYAQELLGSLKDRAENLMIVDLIRNDIGRSCEVGTVKVPELFYLETYPNVHHLVSCVTGKLAAGKDCIDLIFSSFPGGSITGAPKIRAMEIIEEVEPTRRGIYCGSFVYVDVRGEMDSSIAIRTVLIAGSRAYCWGGGGIVSDSEWSSEYSESVSKVKVILTTLMAGSPGS